MSAPVGTIERLASLLGGVLSTLGKALSADPARLFSRLGVLLNEEFLATAAIQDAFSAVAGAMNELSAAIDALNIAIELDDSPAITLQGAASIDRIAAAITKVASIGSALDDAARGDGALSAAQKARFHDIAVDLPKRLFDIAVLDALIGHSPSIAAALISLGLVDIANDSGDASDAMFPTYILKAIRLDRLGALLSQPLQHFESLFGFGLPTFDGLVLFARLKAILDTRYEQAAIVNEPGRQNALQAASFVLAVDASTSPPGLVHPLRLESNEDTVLEFAVGRWTLTLQQKGRFPADSALKLSTSGGIAIVPPYGPATIDCLLSLSADFKEKAFELFSVTGGTVISVANVALGAKIFGSWNPTNGSAEAEPIFTVDLHGGKATLSTLGADGFISKVLGGSNIESSFDVGMDFSPSDGLRFRGSTAFELQLDSHSSVGNVAIEALTLKVEIENGAFPVALTADLKTELGPLTAVIRGIGLETKFAVVAVEKGILGPIDIQFGLRSPTGVGLSLDAGGFKGGGFLRFDAERGEYAGALELDFHGLFSVKAIGIVNTKMLDGSPGFSLLILITAEFTPIQLSFGFTLNGVGGLFALNRTIFVNALAEGIRTNAIKSILFPQDVIANVTRIISDIKQFFPPQEDHFVVGPMVKLGWGTPSIITAELGLLLDLPQPLFAIVGVLRAALPTQDAAILNLQVNFIGVVDFDRGYIFFRADLFDSRLLIYSITGSLAFLVSWGEQQTFALSVGGFHPDFRDIPAIPALPDGFRNMARIGISLLSDDNPRLKVESYFAVTSNTVQFGAKVELYAAAAGFNVYGFLGYDVLFQFNPFHFIAHLYGGIALREDDNVIAGINISAQLAGPNPWDARGTATLTILFFDIDIDFHVTWGDPPPAVESQTEDLLALLKREIADTRNWRADLPPQNHLHVSLRTIEPPDGEAALLVIHPAGVLTFSERALPLEDFQIAKFGTRKPLNENHFKLWGANAGGLPMPADYQGVREQFAISQFSQLSDSDKLSRRSFERLPSGFSLTGTSNLQATMPVTREVVYELNYLRRKPVRMQFKGLVRLALRAYDRLVKSSAVRQSALAHQQVRMSLNAPEEVTLRAEQFAVASVADLTAYAQAGENAQTFSTQAEAYQHQQELVRRNPALAGQIQVVSHFELAS